MAIGSAIIVMFISIGLASLFRPVLLLYLFAIFPILHYIPTISEKERELKLFKVGSVNIFLIDYLTILLAILIFIALINNLLNKKKLTGKLFLSPITKIIVFYFFWEIIICVMSYMKGYHLQNVLRGLSREAILFIALFIPLLDERDIWHEKFLKHAVVIGGVLVCFGLIRHGITNEHELTSSFTFRTLKESAVPVLILPICYILFQNKYWRSHGWMSLMVIIFMAIGIGLAGHRSGWVAFLFVIGVYFLSAEFDITRFLWVPLFSVSLVLLVLLIMPSQNQRAGSSFIGDLIVRIGDTFDTQNSTTQERLDKWKFSIEVMKENPLIGFGRLPVHTKFIDKDENSDLLFKFSELNRPAHNLFAKKLLHEGILGIIILSAFIIVVVSQVRLVEDRRYGLFIKTYILTFFLYSMFNTAFTKTDERIYLVIILGFLNARLLNSGAYDRIRIRMSRVGQRKI